MEKRKFIAGGAVKKQLEETRQTPKKGRKKKEAAIENAHACN